MGCYRRFCKCYRDSFFNYVFFNVFNFIVVIGKIGDKDVIFRFCGKVNFFLIFLCLINFCNNIISGTVYFLIYLRVVGIDLLVYNGYL